MTLNDVKGRIISENALDSSQSATVGVDSLTDSAEDFSKISGSCFE